MSKSLLPHLLVRTPHSSPLQRPQLGHLPLRSALAALRCLALAAVHHGGASAPTTFPAAPPLLRALPAWPLLLLRLALLLNDLSVVSTCRAASAVRVGPVSQLVHPHTLSAAVVTKRDAKSSCLISCNPSRILAAQLTSRSYSSAQEEHHGCSSFTHRGGKSEP